MAERVGIELIDRVKETAYGVVNDYARKLRHLRHCDIRLEVSEGKGASAENGHLKSSAEDYGLSFGVRVLAGSSLVAPGYFGQLLGAADVDNLGRVLREAIRHAHRRALASAERKTQTRTRYGSLGDALYSAELAAVDVRQEVAPAAYRLDPREVPLATVADYAAQVGRAVAGLDSKVAYSIVTASTILVRELFASSEGALIDQTYAQSEGFVFVVAQGEAAPLELYDFTGHLAGWEVLVEGVDAGPVHLPPLMDFATNLARETVEVAGAPPLRPPDEEVVVVTNPHFNALVVHEVMGHPSELDRALKYETSYAGRSWLLKDLTDNQIGRQVASPLVSVFSDPTINGFGHYLYDHEGTPARRVYHVRNGVYEEFMNNRQTAAIMGVPPNGHFRASDASLVPLIRMSNTVFQAGTSDPTQILKEVDRGYYVVGHRIPSVAESRENFRISAMRVYEIRNGELGQLYRDGGIMADSRDYFMRMDAVGNDFALFPIPNCGKGQPMQAKRMGNGGPTMRSVARLMGGTE